jgi:hypothetical protein
VPTDAFTAAVLAAYRSMYGDGGTGLLTRDAWTFLMEGVTREQGLPVQREQLLALFAAADHRGAGAVNLHEVMRMESVRRFFALLAERAAALRAERAAAAAAAAAPRPPQPPPPPPVMLQPPGPRGWQPPALSRSASSDAMQRRQMSLAGDPRAAAGSASSARDQQAAAVAAGREALSTPVSPFELARALATRQRQPGAAAAQRPPRERSPSRLLGFSRRR